MDNPDAARQMLLGLGVTEQRAGELVARYARDARRILLDTKQERERRLLAIRQQLESELSDEISALPASALDTFVMQMIPKSPFDFTTSTGLAMHSGEPREAPSILIQQQFFERVEGVVAQNVQGPVVSGPELDEVIRLIRALGEERAGELEVAARELADSGAPVPARLGARQKLKSFLQRNTSRIEEAAFRTAWKWAESQLGG